MKGKKLSEAHIQKLRESHKGFVIPESTKQKMRESSHKGEDHYLWKGDKANYRTIHDWVRRKLGTPKLCWHCGTDSLPQHKYHWANIDHKYRRKVEDWLRLCVNCHIKYDKETTEPVETEPVQTREQTG